MTRLKLSDLTDEKPVRLTIELPTRLHRELTAYAVALNDGEPNGAPPPERLVPPMIAKFIASDRGYTKMRHKT
jgi:hypothetical protein